MRIDLYTKTILTLIALLLAVMSLRPLLMPTWAHAQSNLNGVQFSGAASGFWLFDGKTGDAWLYSPEGDVIKHVKVTKLGAPGTQ